MSQERDYLYLKGTEELGEIIDIVRNFEGQEVILVIPNGLKALTHATNLEILKRETDRAKKKILFTTEDNRAGHLLKEAGFTVFLDESEDPEAVQKIVTDIISPAPIKTKVKKSDPVENISATGSRRRRPWLRYLTLIVIILVAVSVVVSLVERLSGRATVTVHLKETPQDFIEMIEVRPGSSNGTSTISGERIELQKTHTVQVPTTGEGRGSGRAKGLVMITNSTDQALPIIQGTRFQSADGRIYRSTKRITIPAKLNGGSVSLEIVAEEGAATYNLKAGSVLTIPGLSGTPWAKALTVTTPTGITGGSTEGVKVVTVDDLSQGRIKVEQEIRDTLTKNLSLQYPDIIFPPESGLMQVQISDVSHRVGQATDQITLSAKADLKTIGVKRDILVSFLKNRIAEQLARSAKDKEVTQLEIQNIRVVDLDPKLSHLNLSITGTVHIKGQVVEKEIISLLAGVNLEAVKPLLEKYPQIENVEATIWPFWVRSLPRNPEQITVTIQ